MSYSTINFGDNLIKNKICTITYSGMLFQNNSEFVNIVYGFGNEWHHTKEQEMEKTENGFVVEVNMLNYDTFNFCFRNSNYEWDNNNNQNYTSPITEEVIGSTNFILNDDSVITNIVNTLCEIDVSTFEDTSVQAINETVEMPESVVTAESAPFEIEVETNTPVNIEDSLVNVTEANYLDQDIESLFTDIYQETKVEDQTIINNNFNMDTLIDEILSPIVKSTIFDEEPTITTNFEDLNPTDFIDDLKDLEEDLTLDNKIDSLITDLFNNTRAFAESNKKYNLDTINETEITKAIDDKIEEILAETPSIMEDLSEVQNIETTINELEKNIEVPEIAQAIVKKNVPDFTVIEDEESLIGSINEDNTSSTNNEQTALIEVNSDNDFIVSPRALGKFYMFKKKVKLAFTKLFVTIPKLFAKGLDTENN